MIEYEFYEEELMAMDDPYIFKCWLIANHYMYHFVSFDPFTEFYKSIQWYEHCQAIKEFERDINSNN